jgi:hypothetical protein
MSRFDIIVLGAIIFAFVVFGLTLAWGEHQTRHLSRERTEVKPRGSRTQNEMKRAA